LKKVINSNSSNNTLEKSRDTDDDLRDLPSKIEKIPFEGTDYPSWKFRMVSLLMRYGLLDIVEGKEKSRSPANQKRRDFAYSMLVFSMTDTTLKFAMNAERGDAHKVWLNLQTEYERSTRANKIALRRQLYGLIGTPNAAFTELVGKIDLFCARLKSLGVDRHR
jgi:hypothetical protein